MISKIIKKVLKEKLNKKKRKEFKQSENPDNFDEKEY